MPTTEGDQFVDDARRGLQRLLAKVQALPQSDLREACIFDARDAIDNVDAIARMIDQQVKQSVTAVP